jgi:hypothetical protein
VKPPLAEARGFHAQPLGHSDPPRCFASLRGSRHWQIGQPYIIPSLAVIGMVFFRATRSDAKSDVRKGKALPARRVESVRRHSQERFRTCPSLGGLDRIETVIQDKTGKKGGMEIPPDARPPGHVALFGRQGRR